MNTNGGFIMITKIIEAVGKEITQSFTEISIKVSGRMSNIASNFSSLRLVTVVR